MDAPGGPVCSCGRPSKHESGWCGREDKRSKLVVEIPDLVSDLAADPGAIGRNAARLAKKGRAADRFLRNTASILTDALRDCAISSDNHDTCGVCGHHFADCEGEKRGVWTKGDGEVPTVSEPACAGARARTVLLLVTPDEEWSR